MLYLNLSRYSCFLRLTRLNMYSSESSAAGGRGGGMTFLLRVFWLLLCLQTREKREYVATFDILTILFAETRVGG